MRQLLLEKEISESKTVKSKSKKISPTKDELKKRLAELEKKMKNPTGMVFFIIKNFFQFTL